jgi:hypothetical protein
MTRNANNFPSHYGSPGAGIEQSVERLHLRVGRSEVGIPVKVKKFSQNVQLTSGAHPPSHSINTEVISPMVQPLQREADQSRASRAEVEN